MTLKAVRTAMLRELRALDREIAAYPDDDALWQAPAGAPNSAGNLALHLAGNLRHFIGATLGGSDYKRDRDAEFAAKNLSREDVRALIAAAIQELSDAFEKISDEDLVREYPLPVRLHDPSCRASRVSPGPDRLSSTPAHQQCGFGQHSFTARARLDCSLNYSGNVSFTRRSSAFTSPSAP
jgi:hypothetical protein